MVECEDGTISVLHSWNMDVVCIVCTSVSFGWASRRVRAYAVGLEAQVYQQLLLPR